MKLGDLLRWKDDGDIGLVIAFQEDGLPIVDWLDEVYFHEFDEEDMAFEKVEVLRESRGLGEDQPSPNGL